MIQKAGFGSRMTANIITKPGAKERFLVSSVWDMQHLRRLRRGSVYYWKLIERSLSHNLCTDEGLNKLLDVMFHGATQITTWYIALIESNTTPAAAMTYATPTYTESTAYDEATRPEFVETAASAKSLNNTGNKAQFTMNASKTIYGGALVGGGTAASTKGDTAGGGTLYCMSLYSPSKSVADDDVLLAGLVLTGADA